MTRILYCLGISGLCFIVTSLSEFHLLECPLPARYNKGAAEATPYVCYSFFINIDQINNYNPMTHLGLHTKELDKVVNDHNLRIKINVYYDGSGNSRNHLIHYYPRNQHLHLQLAIIGQLHLP